MGKKLRLNLPDKDAVVKYIINKNCRIKAYEIAEHFNIYDGRPFGPADASRDIGFFLGQCTKFAFKEYQVVICSSRHGHYVGKTEQDALDYEEYMKKHAAGTLRTMEEKAALIRKQIKNPDLLISNLRKAGLLN